MGDFTGKKIRNTYDRVLQNQHGVIHDGLGNDISASIYSLHVNNDFTVAGNVIVSGSVRAEQFHTTTVSSSVQYQSGSTKFGDTLNDTHNFTGSLLITGSTTSVGNSYTTGDLELTGSLLHSGNLVQTGNTTQVGNFGLTGNLTVNGTVTAEQFHTTAVTSSIIYQSGSTRYGDSSDDKHEFTGSLDIVGEQILAGDLTQSGDISLTGNIIQTGNTTQIGSLEITGSVEITGSLEVDNVAKSVAVDTQLLMTPKVVTGVINIPSNYNALLVDNVAIDGEINVGTNSDLTVVRYYK